MMTDTARSRTLSLRVPEFSFGANRRAGQCDDSAQLLVAYLVPGSQVGRQAGIQFGQHS